MTEYNATIELDTHDTSDRVVDALMDTLALHHVAIATSPEGRVSATISYPAEDGAQAAVTALALAGTTGHGLVALHVLPTADFDRRSGMVPVPELLSVTEAAAVLGVTRQAVLELLNRGTLHGTQVGTTWAVPRAAVEARAAQHAPGVESIPIGMAATLLGIPEPEVQQLVKDGALQSIDGGRSVRRTSLEQYAADR